MNTNSAPKNGIEQDSLYDPEEQERRIIEKFNESAKPQVRLKLIFFEGYPFLVLDHADQDIGRRLLMAELGIDDPDFLQTLIGQIGYANSRDKTIDEDGANLMLSVLKGIKPKDQLDTMLGLQMAAVHNLIMSSQHAIANAKDHQRLDSSQRFLINLIKMSMAQIEGLTRYRTGALAQVNVQHVTVSHGGQAVVGNVAQTQRENLPNNVSAPPSAVTNAKSMAENEERVRARRRSNKTEVIRTAKSERSFTRPRSSSRANGRASD